MTPITLILLDGRKMMGEWVAAAKSGETKGEMPFPATKLASRSLPSLGLLPRVIPSAAIICDCANAYLISAAPDLLEACKLALEHAADPAWSFSVVERLGAAIERAEGKW